MTLPEVTVDMAFNAGFKTPAADRVWTDISDYVELDQSIVIRYGRQDELSVADANELRLALDNSDGRFTWGNAASPYYPDVLTGRPIRVVVNRCTFGDYGTFETDADGWTGINASVARTTVGNHHSGSASLEVTASSTGAMSANTPAGTSGIPVKAGAVYPVSAWFRSPAGQPSRTARLVALWYDSGGSFIASETSPSITDSGTWQGLEFSVEAPATAAYVRVRGLWTTPDAGEIHRIDDVRFGDVRITGHITQWPVEWEGTGGYAKAAIAATSRIARLGRNSPLKSVVEEEVLVHDPVAYYTLSEAAGATRANDSSSSDARPLAQRGLGTAVVFGSATGPSTDGLTGATFASGKWLSGGGGVTLGTTATIACAFSAENTAPGESRNLITVGPIDAPDAISGNMYPSLSLSLFTTSGELQASGPDGSGTHQTVFSLTEYDDDAVHVAVLTYADGELHLYVDGALDEDSSFSNPSVDLDGSVITVGGRWLDGSISHAVVLDVALTSTEVSDLTTAMTDGFAGETTDERLARYAAWAGIPAAEVVTTASPITVDHIDPTGVQIMEMMRKVETTEAGVLHDDRDGNLVLEPRSARYGAAVAVTLDADLEQVGDDFAPTVDEQIIFNIGEGRNIDGTATGRYTDETSRDEHGDAIYSVETAALDEEEPYQLAAWAVNAYSEPRPRAASVTVDVLPYLDVPDSSTAALLALDIGSKVQITNAPDQATATTADYFVEGYAETIGTGVWTLTLNLSPAAPYDQVMIFDSPTQGQFDETVFGL